MSDNILEQQEHKPPREVVPTLAELKQRLLYEGDLSEESAALYRNIERTLYEAIGEVYGWPTQEETAQAKTDQGAEQGQIRPNRES